MQETNVLSKQIRAQIHLQRCSLFAQGSERLPEAVLVSWANSFGDEESLAEDIVCGKVIRSLRGIMSGDIC